jgi:hypothetical protein
MRGGVPNEQAQETSQCCSASPTGLDELGSKSFSWCVWGEKCRDQNSSWLVGHVFTNRFLWWYFAAASTQSACSLFLLALQCKHRRCSANSTLLACKYHTAAMQSQQLQQLADAAGVPLRIAYLAEIGGQVEEVEARLLLEALSNLHLRHAKI